MAWEGVTPRSLGPCQGALGLVFLPALPGSWLPSLLRELPLAFLGWKKD